MFTLLKQAVSVPRLTGALTGLAVTAALLFGAAPASAANFSFTGTIAQDDTVQFFNFSVGAASTVTLLTYSYAGGVQADGNVVAQGGFDPILSLFDASTGLLINSNDDGLSSQVGTDIITGFTFDTFLQSALGIGTYTVAVSQFDNFAIGPFLINGFLQTGSPNFTASFGCSNGQFCDVGGFNRTNSWAFDVLNVNSAVVVPPSVIPIPAALPLFLTGLAGLGFIARRKKQAA